jgi:hypothetical protein
MGVRLTRWGASVSIAPSIWGGGLRTLRTFRTLPLSAHTCARACVRVRAPVAKMERVRRVRRVRRVNDTNTVDIERCLRHNAFNATGRQP